MVKEISQSHSLTFSIQRPTTNRFVIADFPTMKIPMRQEGDKARRKDA